MPKIKAILLLAGEGKRISSTPYKQFLPLGPNKEPIYKHTLNTFEKSSLFSDILLVTPKNHPLPNGIFGDTTRQKSCYNGILACGEDTDFVVIHDAVRPFVSIDILKRSVDAVQIHHAVNTCIPTHDTINYVEKNRVTAIPKRAFCMRGQTPQSFSYSLIKKAHEATLQTNAVDDCSLAFELGHPIHVILGSQSNFKITTSHDYLLANSLYTIWSQEVTENSGNVS